MPKKTFQLTLRAKSCDRIFKEGLDPGVLVTQEISYELPDDYLAPMLAMELVRQEDDFIHRHIEVLIKEV